MSVVGGDTILNAGHMHNARRVLPVQAGWWSDFLFALTPILLFAGGFAGEGRKALPYFALAFIVALTQWKSLLTPYGMKIAASPLLLVFMLVHLSMAFYTGVNEGLLRTVQVAAAYAFVVPFVVRYSQVSMREFSKYFGINVALLLLYTIGWHIAHGHMVVWKYLWDTKTAYSLLPFFALAFISSKTPASKVYGLPLLGLIAVVILLSGERKAYILLAIGMLFMANFRNPLTYLAPIAILAIGPLASMLDTSGYVERQISTLTGFAQGDVVKTLSNQQREWQLQYILGLYGDHPIFGIGTGSYVSTMMRSYAASKSDIIVPGIGVHSEFLRVLVENGIAGLIPWVILLVTSAWNAVFATSGRLRSFDERKLAIFLFASVFTYMMFEAFDTTMAVCYCLIAHIWRLRLGVAEDVPVQQGQGVVARRGAASFRRA